MVHGSHTIEMIEGIVYLLALLADERLYETTVVILGNHGGDIALQFRHLAWSPRREIAESHLVAHSRALLAYPWPFTDDIVEFIENPEIDVVDLLHLVFQHFGLHYRVQKNFVGSFYGSQHIETFHQIGHTHIIMPLRLCLAGFQKFLVEQPVGMVFIETDVVGIVGIGMNPDGILTALEYSAKDGGKRTGTQLGIGHG